MWLTSTITPCTFLLVFLASVWNEHSITKCGILEVTFITSLLDTHSRYRGCTRAEQNKLTLFQIPLFITRAHLLITKWNMNRPQVAHLFDNSWNGPSMVVPSVSNHFMGEEGMLIKLELFFPFSHFCFSFFTLLFFIIQLTYYVLCLLSHSFKK